MTFSNGISIIEPGDPGQTKLVFKFSKLPVDLQDKLIARIMIMDGIVAYELAGVTGIVKK